MMRSKKTTYIPDNGNLRIPTREEFHQRFSGIIYLSDYDYPTSLTATANRVASNLRFDETCKLNRELRTNNSLNIIK